MMRNAVKNNYAMVRALLALGSLVSMVLASGAASHWH